MDSLSISSFSLREELGPLFVQTAGLPTKVVEFLVANPKIHSISEFPELARDRLGVDAIETTSLQFSGIDDPEVARFGEAVARSGLRLLNVNINATDLLEPDNDLRRAGIELLERWIDSFAALGSEFVRVNAGSPNSPHSAGGIVPPQHLVDALGHLGAFAAERGARLLIENHGGPSSDPIWLENLLAAVGTSACGLLLDLGNFEAITRRIRQVLMSDNGLEQVNLNEYFSPGDLEPVYAAVTALAPRGEVVSLKVHQVGPDGVIGPLDLGRCIGILARAGFAGPLSLEYEGRGGDPWDNCARILAYTRSVLASLASQSVGGASHV